MSEIAEALPMPTKKSRRQQTVYFYGVGENPGLSIKIGYTNGPLIDRKKSLLSGQMSKVNLHLLVAVPGTSTHEKELHKYFARFKDEANSTETFKIVPELLEYINWLRQQWWVYLHEDDVVDQVPDSNEWMPNAERRVAFEEDDPRELIPINRSYHGPLAGKEPWNRLSTPSKTGNDFYTPKEIVDAARKAMGGIDLDPASHWQANRIHRVPTYYHINRSGFHNPWFGRVWLNPPYGDNAPWFEQIKKYWDSGEIKQLCMISPMWVFQTHQGKQIIQRSSGMVLLIPTPEFWGHPRGKTGTNHPHAIIYLGNRLAEFRDAFKEFGAPVKFDWGNGKDE